MSKHKVKIITFHRAQSYGAFLQAFALQNCDVLSSCSVEIIDYYPTRFHYSNYIKLSKDKNLFKYLLKFFPAFISKTRMHVSSQFYVKKYLKLTTKQYKNPSDIKTLNSDGDLFISGSDQIWDLRYDDIKNVLPYYLSFVDNNRVSYSSSCGEMEYNANQKDKKYQIVLKELSKFRYISTREKKSALDINSCGAFNAEMVLDPTFLLKPKEWDYYLCKNKPRDHYVLVYGLYRNKDLKKYALNLAKKENLKIYNICDMLDYIQGAKNFFNVTPFKLLWLIKNADHVVTDSFHGCALSINYSKELHIFLPKTSKIRIMNIVDIFGLENRLVKTENLLTEKIDYSTVSKILDNERDKSKMYLQKCLKLIEEKQNENCL